MSKKGYIIGAIVIVVIVLFILFSGSGKQNSSTTATKSLQITIAAQNNSGISGNAVITDVDGKSKVVVSVTGAPADIEEPAHLHVGSCANLGDPKYTLAPVINGTAETVLPVSPDELIKELPLAINIHKSAAEVGTYIACGDLTTVGTN